MWEEPVLTEDEYRKSVTAQNRQAVKRQLRTALRLTAVLGTVVPLAIVLAFIDIPQEWHGIRTGFQVFAILEALGTGFAWLWWRGERQKERIEREFFERTD